MEFANLKHENRENLISVIIPCYNHEKYVAKAIESIAGQTYAPIEVLLLDDGSSDGSLEAALAAISRWPGRFVRVFAERQPNAGVSRTLNRLVGLARGAFIVPLASDDALLPHALAHRVAALEKSPHALALFTDSQVMDTDGNAMPGSAMQRLYGVNPARFVRTQDMTATLMLYWGVPGSGLMLRNCAFDPLEGVGLFDEQLRAEDFDFYLRLAARGALAFSSERTALYRIHETNSIGRSGNALMHDNIGVLRRVALDLAPWPRFVARMLARSLTLTNQVGPFGRLSIWGGKALFHLTRLAHGVRELLLRPIAQSV